MTQIVVLAIGACGQGGYLAVGAQREVSMSLSARDTERPAVQWAIVGLFAILFWALRLTYWASLSEPQFSDMLQYIKVGENIRAEFYFGYDSQLYAYFTPVTPSIIALAKVISAEHFVEVFRVMVAALCFSATLLLARELVKLTGLRWIGAATLFAVAFSKPSIFWSYKISTEAVSEALLLSSMGAMFATVRLRTLRSAIVAALFCFLLALNRPQFLPGVLLVPVVLLGAAFLPATPVKAKDWVRAIGVAVRALFRRAPRDPKRALQAGVFVTALAVFWTPWIARNAAHYGALIPTATSGVDTMIWEYAGAPVRVGAYTELPLAHHAEPLRTFSIGAIQERANKPTDIERQAFIADVATSWVRNNLADMPRVYFWRLKQLIAVTGASGLTQVSRTELFMAPTKGFNNPFTQVSWLNLLLLDKAPWVVFLAALGVVLISFRSLSGGGIAATLVAAPWFVVPAVIGYERMVESMITATLVMAVVGVALASRALSAPDQSRLGDGMTTS